MDMAPIIDYRRVGIEKSIEGKQGAEALFGHIHINIWRYLFDWFTLLVVWMVFLRPVLPARPTWAVRLLITQTTFTIFHHVLLTTYILP